MTTPTDRQRLDTLIGLVVALLGQGNDPVQDDADIPMEEWPEYVRARALLGYDKLGVVSELDALATVREAVERRTRTAVALARKQEVSWESIGASLGVTKQAAQQRYGG